MGEPCHSILKWCVCVWCVGVREEGGALGSLQCVSVCVCNEAGLVMYMHQLGLAAAGC